MLLLPTEREQDPSGWGILKSFGQMQIQLPSRTRTHPACGPHLAEAQSLAPATQKPKHSILKMLTFISINIIINIIKFNNNALRGNPLRGVDLKSK